MPEYREAKKCGIAPEYSIGSKGPFDAEEKALSTTNIKFPATSLQKKSALAHMKTQMKLHLTQKHWRNVSDFKYRIKCIGVAYDNCFNFESNSICVKMLMVLIHACPKHICWNPITETMGSSFMDWISALKERFQKDVMSIHAFCHLSTICLLQSMQHHDAILKAQRLYTD